MGFFDKVLKIAGLGLSFIPGFQFLGLALMVGGTILEQREMRKAAKKAQQHAEGQTFMIQAPIIPRRLVYGKTRLGGALSWHKTVDGNREYFAILTLCDGPIEGIDDIYFNDEKVGLEYISGYTFQGTGKWAGLVNVEKHLGATDQPASPWLLSLPSHFPEWTSDHRFLGVAYIVVRIVWTKNSQEVFPQGRPNISADVRGFNTVKDGRDDSTGYKNNRALCLAHYLSHVGYGPELDIDNDIDQDSFDAAATACDEWVSVKATGTVTVDASTDVFTATGHKLELGHAVEISTDGTLPGGLSASTKYYVIELTADTFKVSTTLDGSALDITSAGTGTHTFTTFEHRYTFNGMISLEDSPEEIIRQFSVGMAGVTTYVQGKWHIFPGVWVAPTFTIDEDMIIDDVTITPRHSQRDRVNTVKGFYLPAKNRYQPTAYPVVSNASYVTADGGKPLIMQADFQDVRTSSAAQRIGKILLELNRLETRIELTTNLEGFKATAGRNVMLNLPTYGFTNEPFLVEAFDFVSQDGKLGVRMVLSQTSSSAYGWTPASDETEQEQQDTPTLPDGSMTAPSGFTASNPTGEPIDGIVRIDFSWTAPTQVELVNGFVIIEKKLSSEGSEAWQEFAYHSANDPGYEWNDALPGEEYDFRIKFQSPTGAESGYTEYNSYTPVVNTTTSKTMHVYDNPTPATQHVINHNFGREATVVTVWMYDGGTPTFLLDGEQLRGAIGDTSGLNSLTLNFTTPVGIYARIK